MPWPQTLGWFSTLFCPTVAVADPDVVLALATGQWVSCVCVYMVLPGGHQAGTW